MAEYFPDGQGLSRDRTADMLGPTEGIHLELQSDNTSAVTRRAEIHKVGRET